jgi:hypothetical protein
MYLLGIDGGGTKLDFLLTDLDKKEVLHFQYEANSNLKYAGPANIIKLLSAGLDQITQTVPLNEISFTYLGIAECGRGCGITGRDEIVVFLDSRLQKYFLGDDQYFEQNLMTNTVSSQTLALDQISIILPTTRSVHLKASAWAVAISVVLSSI